MFLDGAGSEHLLLQMFLVFADAAIPPCSGLVLAHHDVLCNLVEQSRSLLAYKFRHSAAILSLPEVVRYHNYTSRKGVDSISQRVNSRDVETVGRLVQ